MWILGLKGLKVVYHLHGQTHRFTIEQMVSNI